MAPAGIEPAHTDSKSVALSTELRGRNYEGWRTGLEPATTGTTTRGSPTELPPPRSPKDSFGWGEALARRQEHEHHRPERHRDAEEPYRSELDRTELPCRHCGPEDLSRGRRRGSGEQAASQPTNLRWRHQDELRADGAEREIRCGSGIQAGSIVEFEKAQSSLVRGTRDLGLARAQGRRQTILPVYFSAPPDGSTFVTTQGPYRVSIDSPRAGARGSSMS